METSAQKKRRIVGRKYFQAHLRELRKLVNSDVNPDYIISLVKTDEILNGFIGNKVFKEKILFENKTRLLTLFNSILKNEQNSCYLFISTSAYCGAYKLSSLRDFYIQFDYEDEHVGLISIINSDLNLKILLDFYEELDNKYLEIEIHTSVDHIVRGLTF